MNVTYQIDFIGRFVSCCNYSEILVHLPTVNVIHVLLNIFYSVIQQNRRKCSL